MKKMFCMLIIMSFLVPLGAHAGMVGAPDPVEKNLIENERLNQEMNKDMNKPVEQPAKTEAATSGSNWWKWALGLVVIGGAAAAASSHGGGSGSSGSGGSTGNGTVSW